MPGSDNRSSGWAAFAGWLLIVLGAVDILERRDRRCEAEKSRRACQSESRVPTQKVRFDSLQPLSRKPSKSGGSSINSNERCTPG
jgi:hypothetical protein